MFSQFEPSRYSHDPCPYFFLLFLEEQWRLERVNWMRCPISEANNWGKAETVKAENWWRNPDSETRATHELQDTLGLSPAPPFPSLRPHRPSPAQWRSRLWIYLIFFVGWKITNPPFADAHRKVLNIFETVFWILFWRLCRCCLCC